MSSGVSSCRGLRHDCFFSIWAPLQSPSANGTGDDSCSNCQGDLYQVKIGIRGVSGTVTAWGCKEGQRQGCTLTASSSGFGGAGRSYYVRLQPAASTLFKMDKCGISEQTSTDEQRGGKSPYTSVIILHVCPSAKYHSPTAKAPGAKLVSTTPATRM